jgi:hypothetical protein
VAAPGCALAALAASANASALMRFSAEWLKVNVVFVLSRVSAGLKFE